MDFLPRLHATIRAARLIKKEAQHGTLTESKVYPRFDAIALPAPSPLPASLSEALDARRSFKTCASGRALKNADWGTLLGSAVGAKGESTRAYPSAGALFPIELYIVGNVLDSHANDVFHYNAHAHTLEHLWKMPESVHMKRLFRGSDTPLSTTAIILTALWNRSADKYGDFAYDLALIEVGHVAQNILLAAAARSIAARPIASFDDTSVETLLDIDPAAEQPVYALMLCPAAGATERAVSERPE